MSPDNLTPLKRRISNYIRKGKLAKQPVLHLQYFWEFSLNYFKVNVSRKTITIS